MRTARCRHGRLEERLRNAVVWLVVLSLLAIASCRAVGQGAAPTATTVQSVSNPTPSSTRAARTPSTSSTATTTDAAASPTRSTAPPTVTPAMTSETPVPTTSSAGASLDLQAIAFADTRHGWVAGAGIILATTDGGQSWTRQYGGTGTIHQLDVVSATDGWAVEDDALLHTSDGGRSWLPVGKPPVPLTRVDFVTATVGWGTTAGAGMGQGPYATRDASKDLLYVTHDAGRTWTLQHTPIPVGGMCFVDAERGWVVNAPVAAAPALLATADGGQTWQAVSPPPVFPPATPTPNGEQAPFRQTLRCVQPNVLWDLVDLGPIGVGGGDSYVLARSPDGGQHWQGVAQHLIHVPSLAAVPPGPGKYDGAFDAVDATTAYLTGACGIGCGPPEGTTALGRTTDGGRTWQNSPAIPGLPATFAAPAFPRPTRGWLLVRWNVPPPAGSTVSPARSAILATRDGGMSWTLQYPRSPFGPVGVVAFANPNAGCCL